MTDRHKREAYLKSFRIKRRSCLEKLRWLNVIQLSHLSSMGHPACMTRPQSIGSIGKPASKIQSGFLLSAVVWKPIVLTKPANKTGSVTTATIYIYKYLPPTTLHHTSPNYIRSPLQKCRELWFGCDSLFVVLWWRKSESNWSMSSTAGQVIRCRGKLIGLITFIAFDLCIKDWTLNGLTVACLDNFLIVWYIVSSMFRPFLD